MGLLLGLAAATARDCRPAPASSPDAAPADTGWASLAWRLLPVGMAASAGLALMLAHNRDSLDYEPRSLANRRLAAHWTPEPPRASASDTLTAYGLPIIDLRPDAPDAHRIIRVEGESFASATGAFRRIQDNDASGHLALEIPADSGKAQGEARYSLDLSSPGVYRLSARVFWEDGCSNSLAFQVNDTRCGVSSELFSHWHELQSPVLLDLPAGPVMIVVQNLEDGVRLDYFQLVYLGPSEPTGTN
jgi:hypothetical protein